MEIEPSRVVVWTPDESLDPAALAAAFHVPVEISPRPVPVLPDPLSKLLPADVRAARRMALRRRNITLAAAAVVLIYLVIAGWFGYGLWRKASATKHLLTQARQVAPEGEAYDIHVVKWQELANAIDLGNSPVDILRRVALCIPPGSGLRLKTAEISASDIKLIGEAPTLQAVNTFSLKLSKTTDLANFTWQNPEPNQSTRGWDFIFSGNVRTPEAK